MILILICTTRRLLRSSNRLSLNPMHLQQQAAIMTLVSLAPYELQFISSPCHSLIMSLDSHFRVLHNVASFLMDLEDRG